MRLFQKRAIVERRKTVPERIFFVLMWAVLAVWSVIMLGMLVWAIISSLKTNLDYVNNPLSIPEWAELRWENFLIAIKKMEHNGVGFIGMLINSLWLVLGTTFLGTFTVCVTGYILAQYDFKGKSILFGVVLFSMMIPIYGSFAANYKLIYDLKLDNSFWFLITALSGFNGSVLITYGYFKGIPRAYREAVFLDGGGHLTAFFKVGLPLGKNIFWAYFLLNFIAGWNNYETSILYFDNMPSLASGLYYFQQEIVYEANNPAYFAGSLMAMLPVLVLFILFNGKIMGQMAAGGLKE